MRVLEVQEYRYGSNATDQSITVQYMVTVADATVKGYEVVYCNNQTEAYAGEKLPKIWDRHPNARVMMVLPGGISATRSEANASKWIVTVVYTATGILVDDIYQLKFGSNTYREVASGAYSYVAPNGNNGDDITAKFPFINSAGERYDPADTQIEFQSVIVQFVKRHKKGFSYVNVLDYVNTINSKDMVILGIPVKKHQGLLRTVTPEIKLDENGDVEWNVFYEIEIMPRGRVHQIKLQDQGYSAAFLPDYSTREILMSDVGTLKNGRDAKITKPRLLNPDGTISTSDPKFWEYRVNKETDWETELEFPSNAIDMSTTGNFLEGQL